MALVALSTLRTRVRERCNMENSTFVTDSELRSYINAAGAELHDLLIMKLEEDYFLNSSTVNIVAGTSTYSLPADFYKLRGVDLASGSDVYTLEPFNFSERNNYQNTSILTRAGTIYFYRVQGSNIVFSPEPTASATATLWYHPVFTELSDDADTLTGVNGWEEYVVVDAAIRCLSKEEGDVSVVMAQKAALTGRIDSLAANRDSMPKRWNDVEIMRSGWWFDGWG